MTVHIQTLHFDADRKLVEYVTNKLEKLNTFHDRIIKVDVFLKLDNVVHTIKDKIAEIFKKEDPSKPLSDQEVVKMLSDQGILIARRTVAKYRSELNILPSNLRKVY